MWIDTNRVWEWLGTSWTNVLQPVPIDFPNSPVNDQIFRIYQWDATFGVWEYYEPFDEFDKVFLLMGAYLDPAFTDVDYDKNLLFAGA
jgi:hypothetical protein